jgi:peptide/nickel transport system substrate-binding protein
MRWWKRCACILLTALVLTACAGAPQSISVQSTRLIYGLSFEPSGIDPHINASSELGIPLRMVYDTLVYRDPSTGEFVPGLAESWSISADGTQYTFRLKAGVRFHDGTPLNAQAVAANLDRITNPDTASQKSIFMLGTYAGYQVMDDLTITVLLSQPYSPLLDAFSQVYLGVASPAALAAVSRERYQFNQVGSGPYQFVEYVPGDRIVIRRSRDYAWGPSFYQTPELNPIDEVEFRFFPDASSRALALEARDAQVVGEVLPIDARALLTESDLRLLHVGIPGQPLQFLINTLRFPTNNRDVRRALLFLTNREAISAAVFQRFSPVAWGPLSATTPFYFGGLQGLYAHDPAQAGSLLANAGLTDADNNGYLDDVDSESGDLEVRVLAPPWGQIRDVVQLLEDQWRLAGVRAQIVPVATRAELFEIVSSGDYHLVPWYEFGADPAFLNNYYSSSGTLNWTGYQNPNLDALLVQGARVIDPAARASAYAQAQEIIMQEALILPIRDYVNLNGIRQEVQNLAFDRYGWYPLLVNASIGG